jgi:hypothetical protein
MAWICDSDEPANSQESKVNHQALKRATDCDNQPVSIYQQATDQRHQAGAMLKTSPVLSHSQTARRSRSYTAHPCGALLQAGARTGVLLDANESHAKPRKNNGARISGRKRYQTISRTEQSCRNFLIPSLLSTRPSPLIAEFVFERTSWPQRVAVVVFQESSLTG